MAEEPRSRDVGIIVGIMVCLALFIALILIIFFYWFVASLLTVHLVSSAVLGA